MADVFLFFFSPSAPSQKINRRLHLSKVKHSKFNESGQLVAFHLTSVIWCLYVVVTVRHGAGRALGSLGGICGFWSAKPQWQRRVPSQPLGQDGHISARLVFKCGGSFQPLSEGNLGRSFCFVQGTSKWAVKYFWSWTPEILPGLIISICCSGTCHLSQPLIFLLICVQCLGVFGCRVLGLTGRCL